MRVFVIILIPENVLFNQIWDLAYELKKRESQRADCYFRFRLGKYDYTRAGHGIWYDGILD